MNFLNHELKNINQIGVRKTIKTMLLIVALTFSSVLVAASTNTEGKRAGTVAITEEIGKLLQNPSFAVDHEITANVTVTLNNNNEFVVLSVETDAYYVENFIKSRLNYKQLPVNFNDGEKKYIVPVRITPEEG